MRAVFDPLAQLEFDAACRHYDEQRPGLGDEFAESVRKGLRRILAWPLSGACERGDIRRQVLTRFPYKLLYSVEPDHLYIVAVAHQHRQPAYWLDRIGKP